MFRRTFWFTAGAAAGVWATTKVHHTLSRLTPESLAAQAADRAIETGHKLKDFALDVRDGMVRREAELGGALGLDAPADSVLPGRVLPDGKPADCELPARRPVAVEAAEPRRAVAVHRKLPFNSYNRNEDH